MTKQLELEIVLKVKDMAGAELSALESSVDSLGSSLAALETHEPAFAQQEAAEALVYWNEISPVFASGLEAQVAQLELLTLGFAKFQQVWDDTFNQITSDGEVTAEEFGHLTDRQKELGFAMEATRFAAGLLSEVNLLDWAEGVGISSELAAAYIALISGAGDDLQFVLDSIANGESPALIAAQLQTMNEVGGPPLSELAGHAGRLENHLRGIPASVNSRVNVSFNVDSNIAIDKLLDLGISLGMARAIVGELDPTGQASGGPLADLALVGEEGPELIIDGIVIPAQETRKLMALGLLPKRRFALGGPLKDGPMLTAPPGPSDFDAAAVLPDTTAASQAAAALAPSTVESANEQLSRQLGCDIQASNERLMARIDRLILETRRMKIYFRDAVRLISV